MPSTTQLNVDKLHLDLSNFRTVHQKNETQAIKTMIAVSPDRFWALMDSLLDDGYHPTENIIILSSDNKYLVKEGNRRIAALKIIAGRIIPSTLRDNSTCKLQR
jgi:hypothetical protein